jgi:type IV pilus assembly protein PilQ
MLAALTACLLAVTMSLAQVDAPEPDGAPADPGIASGSRPGELLQLDVEDDGAGPLRVTLTADRELAYESFVLDSPDRLVVDLQGVVNRLDRYSHVVDARGIARVRTAQHVLEPIPVTRVVFDLQQALPYRIEQSAARLSVAFGEVDEAAGEPASSLAASAAPAPDPVQRAAVAPARPAEPGVVEPPPPNSSRSVEPALIERLLSAPAFAAPEEGTSAPSSPSTFESQTIVTEQVVYSGKRISLNLRDADIKEVFRLFHEISGLNFVLDPGVSGRVTIVLDQVPWDQALDLILKNNGLDKVLEQNVLRIATTQKLAQEAAARKQLREAKELEVEPITLTRTLSYGKATDVERVIREGGVLSQRGRVIVDERTNTLIISDVPKKVEPLDTLINTLDSETPQVMIEARIVETSREFTQDLGVDWGFAAVADASRGTATGLSFPHNASARYGLNLPGDGGASNLNFSFGNIVDSFTLDIALNTLEIEGHGRILSSPKVATQNNERAEIEQGVRVPIVNTTATEINVEFVSASLRLVVTPQITAEGTIILDIEVENNSPDFFNTAGGIPSIRTQRAQTKVLINDGGTTVIGGIFTVNEGQSESGVPWFRKVPVFGWLFRTRSLTTQNRELLIFITPKIVKLS